VCHARRRRWAFGIFFSSHRPIQNQPSPVAVNRDATDQGHDTPPVAGAPPNVPPPVTDRNEANDHGQNRSHWREWARFGLEIAALSVLTWYACTTYRLLREAVRQNNETQDSNERAQRAYVMIPRIDLTHDLTPTAQNPNVTTPAWGIRVAYENSGQTPATITAIGPFPAKGPPPASPEQCPGYKAGPTPTAMIIPPRVPRGVYVHSPELEEAFSWAFRDRARNHITMYGVFEYIDTFTKGTGKIRRHTTYCYVLNPAVNLTNADRFTYTKDAPERSAFIDCAFCNSWD